MASPFPPPARSEPRSTQQQQQHPQQQQPADSCCGPSNLPHILLSEFAFCNHLPQSTTGNWPTAHIFCQPLTRKFHQGIYGTPNQTTAVASTAAAAAASPQSAPGTERTHSVPRLPPAARTRVRAGTAPAAASAFSAASSLALHVVPSHLE